MSTPAVQEIAMCLFRLCQVWFYCLPLFLALPAMHTSQVSVSGLSSGGYMAVQFEVAFSSLVRGAGIIAGGPYYCAHGDPITATSLCSCTAFFCNNRPGAIGVETLVRITDRNARRGPIDPPSNLARHRIWLFSGKADSIVPQTVMNDLAAYYANYVEQSGINYKADIDAQHAQPTDFYGNSCATLATRTSTTAATMRLASC